MNRNVITDFFPPVRETYNFFGAMIPFVSPKCRNTGLPLRAAVAAATPNACSTFAAPLFVHTFTSAAVLPPVAVIDMMTAGPLWTVTSAAPDPDMIL